MSTGRAALIAIIAVIVFTLDRITKALVVATIPLHSSRDVIGDVVRLTHTQNSGAAFGLLPERTTLLSILSVVAVVVILYYYRQLASRSALIAATLGMQLGG